jgi:hypothetical protein
MKNILLIIILLLSANFAAAQESKKVQDFNRAADLAVEINSNYPLKFSPATEIFTAADKETLGKIAKAFKNFPNGTVIEIGAHVFAAAYSQSNLDLSAKRAAAVRTALINLGINPKALTTRAYGDKRPLYAVDNPQERQKNNRITFLVALRSQKENFAVVLKSSDSFDGKFSPHPDSFKNAAPNPAQSAAASALSDKITFDKGWGNAVIGAKSQQAVEWLGKPEQEYLDQYLDIMTLYYPQKGLIVETNILNDKITKLTFIGDATVNPVPKNEPGNL